MTALGKFVLAVAVVAALLVGTVVGTVSGTCASVPTTARAGLFTGSGVDWGCEAPFDCLVAFCGCIAANSSNHDVQCLSGIFNVNATTASQLESCSATLATCTLNAALASPGVSNRSCRAWGQPLAQQYALAYTARAAGDTTLSNLTASCEVDFCGVAQSVSNVNVSLVCSFVNFSWPAPIPQGVMPQCAASHTSRSYYTDLPLSSCSDVATCVQTFCGCVNGTWNATTKDCNVPDDVNVTSPACLTSAVSCLLSAALSAYVPGASPLSPNACVAWSVPFAEDYAAYYSASAAQRSSTLLYQSCNFTACNLAIGELGTTDFSTVCNLPTTVQPTFTAYNPCPYRCPDATCAFNLAGCACTANAAIRDVQVVTAPTVSASVDVSKPLSLAAYANYSVASGNCSGFNFNSAASFRWTLFSVSGGVLTTVRDANSSTLALSAGSLTGGTSYMLVLRITGLLASQAVARTYNFTATVPAPTLAFRNGATARLGTSSSLTLAVTVTDFDKSVASYNWDCVATSGTCPTLTNQTNVTAVIPANSTDGVYTITYTYRSATVSISVTIVDGSLPVVSIYASTKALNAVPLVYLSSQSIVIGSAVVYSSKNVSYAWTIGSNTTVIGTGATLVLDSSNLGALTTTSVANAVASTLTTNTVTLNVTAGNGAFGSSSLSVVVLEPLTMTLTVANAAGGSSATSLSDTLLLTPVVTGLTTVPFAAVSTTALSFTDNVSGTLRSTGLTTTPSGSAFTATAPMLSSYLSASTTFTATLALNGIPAASATATFALTAPADKSAAAASVLTNLGSTTDPSALAQAAATLSALALSSGNDTVKAAAASGLVSSLSNVNVANLPADQAQNLMSSLATLLPALDAATLTSQASSLQTAMTSTLANADADTAKAVADAAAALPAKNAAATYVAVGAALMKNVEVGQNVVVSKPGLEVAATAASASSLGGASYGSGASCAPYAELADGFTLPGTSSTDVVSIALTKSAAAPYGNSTPSGSTLTMEVLVNGASFDVSGLTVPIKLTLACDAGTGGCQFNSAASPTWTASSDVTTSVVNGRTVCTTPHLTSFGTFGSGSAIVVSFVALILALTVQLL